MFCGVFFGVGFFVVVLYGDFLFRWWWLFVGFVCFSIGVNGNPLLDRETQIHNLVVISSPCAVLEKLAASGESCCITRAEL